MELKEDIKEFIKPMVKINNETRRQAHNAMQVVYHMFTGEEVNYINEDNPEYVKALEFYNRVHCLENKDGSWMVFMHHREFNFETEAEARKFLRLNPPVTNKWLGK